MKEVFKNLSEFKVQSILAPLFKLLEAFFDLLVPLVVAKIIDVGIANNDHSYIIQHVLIMLLLAAAGLTVSILAQYFAAVASVGCVSKMRQKLFDHIQSLSEKIYDQIGSSTLITRMTSDMQQIQNGVNMSLRLLLRSPMIVIGSMIMAFTIDVKCALVFAVAIPVLSVVVYGIMVISIPLFRKVQSALDSLLDSTRENLTGVRVIRAFSREKSEVSEFDQKNKDLTHLNEFVGRLSALLNPATFVLINIATIVLINVGAIQVNLGIIKQGEIVALYNYMAQMIVELVKLASLIILINKSIASAERVQSVLEMEPGMDFPKEYVEKTGAKADESSLDANESATNADIVNSESSSVPVVEFKNVSLTYEEGAAPAIENISFTAMPGDTIGIIGGTGSGKSSLVNLIPRFYDCDAATKTDDATGIGTASNIDNTPQTGSGSEADKASQADVASNTVASSSNSGVFVFGKNVKDYPKGQLISHIGVVPQKAMLFVGTIRDNLKWGNEEATDEDLWSAIKTAQAYDVVSNKDGQLDCKVEQNGKNFSGGQKQRLTIARALAKNPEILIMDDSASALDFATDAALRKAINALPGNMTVFIVSQRASSIRNADKILVLDDGKLAGIGKHDELLKENEVYQEIYYSQFPEEKPKDLSLKQPGSSVQSNDAMSSSNINLAGGDAV